jgi:hypothetical protein
MTKNLFKSCTFIFLVLSTNSAFSEEGCGKVNEQLAYLKSTTPVIEAEKIIASGKLKVLGIYGYALEIPGIEDDIYYSCYEKTLPTEGIMGTTDYIKYFCQGELNQYARNYAEEFNKKILQHLKKIGFRCNKKKSGR